MMRIIPATHEDIPDFIAIIESVFIEYGWIFKAEDELPDFLAYGEWYVNTPHRLYAVWEDGRRVGCIALKTGSEGAYLSRVYLSQDVRGKGYGRAMVDFILHEARGRGYDHVHLWTDTRFQTAHRLYEATGFERGEAVRALHDTNISFEYRYDKVL